MLYSDSIRSVRKAAQLYNRWNLSTFTRNSITAKRFRNEIENRANPNPVLHETDILVEISTKRGTTGGEKCGKNLEKSAYQI